MADGDTRSLLAEAIGSISPKPVSKRSRRSDQFAQRIKTNAQIAENLLKLIKQMNRTGKNTDEVEKLIDMVQELLDNNSKLQETVVETLLDIPN